MRRTDPRELSGSGLDGALDLLTPPFAAAAARDVLPLTAGRFDIEGPRRRPAVLIRLKVALARSAVVIHPTVDDVAKPAVVFAAYSPAGSLLPLYVPELPAGSDGTGSFSVDVQVWHLDGPDTAGIVHDAAAVAKPAGRPLATDAAASLVEAVVLDGTLSRLIFLGTLEKQRLIAAGREITAGRHVGLARQAALDAHGADLAVPRLPGEDDDAYRARLAIFSSWRLATPAGFAAALNGPSGAGEPAAGLPSTVGVTARFKVVEQANQLAIAVRLVEVGGTVPFRDRFQALLTSGLLFDLDSAPAKELPETTRDRLDRVRTTLIASLQRDGTDNTRYLARLCATTLERAVRLLSLLTGDGSLTLVRAWTAAPDPLHELGLGVTLKRIEPARLRAAAMAVQAAQRAAAAGRPVTFRGVGGRVPGDLMATVLGAQPRNASDDPAGAWLFTAAGMITVTAPDAATVYVSPLPSFGLIIEGPAGLAPGAAGDYTARLRQDASSGRHILVDEAWARAEPDVAAIGGASAPLTPEDLRTLLQTLATAAPALPPALSPLASAGLAPALPGELASRILEAYDLDLLLGIPVADDPAGLVPDSAGAQALRDRMIARSSALTAAGFHSVRVLPAPAGPGVVLLAALSVLPGGSNRPGEPPPAAYLWQLADLGSGAEFGEQPHGTESGELHHGTEFGELRHKPPAPVRVRRGVGGRAQAQAIRPGLVLLACVAYVRRGLADPYEVRIELPGDEMLTLGQYGYVLNVLEHLCPLGIEINTFDLRRNHLSVGVREPAFVSGPVSHSYSKFHRRRTGGTDRYPDATLPRR